MKRYANLEGRSGVMAYEAGRDYIIVQFVDGDAYLYSNTATGKEHVAHMKRLAAAGRGLSTYISRYVKNKYARKR